MEDAPAYLDDQDHTELKSAQYVKIETCAHLATRYRHEFDLEQLERLEMSFRAPIRQRDVITHQSAASPMLLDLQVLG